VTLAVALVLQLSVGAICVLAAVEKLRQGTAFVAGLEAYRLVPQKAVAAVATLVIVAEVVAGTSLLLNIAPVAGALGATVLFAIFTTALAANLIRGNRVPCNCFGPSNIELISNLTLLRTALLLVMALSVFAFRSMHSISLGWESVVPAATVAGALVVLLRIVGVLRTAFVFLTTRPPQPRPSRVLTWKDAAMDVTLRRRPAPDGALPQ
jgi:hypothetical protein